MKKPPLPNYIAHGEPETAQDLFLPIIITVALVCLIVFFVLYAQKTKSDEDKKS